MESLLRVSGIDFLAFFALFLGFDGQKKDELAKIHVFPKHFTDRSPEFLRHKKWSGLASASRREQLSRSGVVHNLDV
jgi:hypothetical protein